MKFIPDLMLASPKMSTALPVSPDVHPTPVFGTQLGGKPPIPNEVEDKVHVVVGGPLHDIIHACSYVVFGGSEKSCVYTGTVRWL